jgi:hypothetical protein
MLRPVAVIVCALLLLTRPAVVRAEQGLDLSGEAYGLVGDTKCGNPTCHGSGLPTSEAEKANWKPWKSARTQWLNRNIDRHSRAYSTLLTDGGKQIARYMGIDGTQSDKCLACHAPPAKLAPGSSFKKTDGVSCEACHGPAQEWLTAHIERDWNAKKASYYARGFYDNSNFKLRAERCAACHTEIDHEIVAGGHPPLQFEMVAYAQIMKHWDDQEDVPAGSFSVDPTLWGVGQVVGLRRILDMVATRAGESNYQSLGKFSHFEDKNCFQCHHKLVADAIRQAKGHYLMVDQILAVRGGRGSLAGAWGDLVSAAGASADATRQKAQALKGQLAGIDAGLLGKRLDQGETKQLLKGILASGDKLRSIDRFSWSRPPRSNVLSIVNIDEPWWYTTGGPEQAVLAVGALCDPAFGAAACRAITPQRRTLIDAVDRFSYNPDQFVRSLGAISAALK